MFTGDFLTFLKVTAVNIVTQGYHRYISDALKKQPMYIIVCLQRSYVEYVTNI